MNLFEKFYATAAIFFLFCLTTAIIIIPQARTFSILVPLALAGIAINAGLLFIVFKDIMARSFQSQSRKVLWAAAVFLFFPVILVYLPLHGFRPRT